MATVKKGPMLGLSGICNGTRFSVLKDGTTVASSIPVRSSKPFTKNQEAIFRNTTSTADFMRAVEGFVRVSYELQAKRKKMNTHNAMVSHFRKEAMVGNALDKWVDYSKLLFSVGQMQPPENVSVSIVEFGLTFNWDSQSKYHGDHYSDQVMLMAYFPDLQSARYMTAGAQRMVGTDLLTLTGIAHGNRAEVYISFISDDRRRISNSIYLGNLIW